MRVVFELGHKYVATLLEDKVVKVLPETAGSTFAVEIENSIEFLSDKLVAHWRELRRPLVKDKYTCYFYTPSTPWQHIKEVYSPDWLKRRFPVKTTSHKRTVKFTRFASYPMADIPLSKKFGDVVIEDAVGEF